MKICELCGIEFQLRPVINGKRKNFQKRKYCLECSPLGIHNTKRLTEAIPKDRPVGVELTCSFCGKLFRKLAKHVRAARKVGQDRFFCSLKCINLKEKIDLICDECGKRFSVRPSALNKNGRKFCSRKCSNSSNNRLYKRRENHPNWKDGSGSYRAVGLKDQCEDCGEKRYWLLIVHHKDKDRTKNEKKDLVTLCITCHALRHLVVVEGKLRVRWNTLTTLEAKALLEHETKVLRP